MSDCIFCKIIKGEIPSYAVFENDDVYAFLDIKPVHHGHTLVIPKAHSDNATEMNEGAFTKLSAHLPRIARAVQEATGADGINITFNCGSAAGQEIFHTHAHIIPCYKNDIDMHWPHTSYQSTEAQETADRIRGNLS